MADRFPGHIKLGGTITIETVEQREAVEQALGRFAEFTAPEWGESSWRDTINLDNYNEFLDDDGYLHGKHDQARYGMFEELEDACREADIAYDRHSSARYEYDAEFARWRPGMIEASVYDCLENGDQQIKVDEVKKLIDDVLYIKDETPYLDRIHRFKDEFGKLTGGEIGELEPLVIIDNAPPEEE